MLNRGWVIGGIILFAAMAGFPFYWHAMGPSAPFPKLELPLKEKACVEPVAYMRSDHMRLLDAWRIAVVRDDLLVYTASDGRKFEMNLHKTCMGCHTSRGRFCDRCHEYNDVAPPCWDCHVAPEESPKHDRSEVRRAGVHQVTQKGDIS